MDKVRKTTKPKRLFWQLFNRENSIIGRERLGLLFFCYIPIMVLGVLANFLGITEPSANFFNYTHSVCLLAACLFLYFYLSNKIDISICLSAFTIIGQTILSIEMTYCASNPTPYYKMLIMANTVLLGLNTTVALAAYLKITTTILAFATECIYILCAFISDDKLLKSFIIVFGIAFFFVGIVGVLVTKVTNKLMTDYEQMKTEEVELLNILRLRKDEVRAFVSLASRKNDIDATTMFMSRLGKKTKLNLLNNVENYIRNKNTDLATIEKTFPELSPSEREICRLILQNKKLGEICLTLNKTESNITTQRTNMRRKLGLKPSDDLQKFLQNRIDSQA